MNNFWKTTEVEIEENPNGELKQKVKDEAVETAGGYTTADETKLGIRYYIVSR